MTIEVKQLTIKSSVESKPALKSGCGATVELDAYKEQLLEQCRALVGDLLRQRQER